MSSIILEPRGIKVRCRECGRVLKPTHHCSQISYVDGHEIRAWSDEKNFKGAHSAYIKRFNKLEEELRVRKRQAIDLKMTGFGVAKKIFVVDESNYVPPPTRIVVLKPDTGRTKIDMSRTPLPLDPIMEPDDDTEEAEVEEEPVRLTLYEALLAQQKKEWKMVVF